eukprot:1219593-Karenia_brevis.AAC.1
MGFMPLPLRILREIHRTASMLQHPKSSRFTASRRTFLFLCDAIQWRDTFWWREQQALGQTLDPGGSALNWKHASSQRNRGVTWDAVFVHAYGLRW